MIKWIFALFVGAVGLADTHLIQGFCGEGPTPWSQSESTYKTREIPVKGEQVKDFLYWEGKNALVYRNERNQLYQQRLSNNEMRLLSLLHQPISRVVDSQERYILTQRKSYILDASSSSPKWHQFGDFAPVYQHLFWNFGDLYSLASSSQEEFKRKITVNRYSPRESRPVSCTLEAKPGEEFHLASGHEFPMIYLYKTAPASEPGKTKLTLVELRVGRELGGRPCDTEEHTFVHPIFGNVKEVHFFSRNRRAIRTDHTTHSMMWWNGEQGTCKYLYLGDREVIAPNYSRHVFFTYDSLSGLKMYFPGAQKPIEESIPLDRRISEPKDMVLNSYGDRLFVPIERDSRHDGNIVEIRLRGDYDQIQ